MSSSDNRTFTLSETPEDLKLLTDSHYNLVVAHYMGTDSGNPVSNIIWNSTDYTQLTEVLTIPWTMKYAINFTRNFPSSGETVTGSNKDWFDVTMGSTYSIAQDGEIAPSSKLGTPGFVTVVPPDGGLHPGTQTYIQFALVSTDSAGKKLYKPFFIDPSIILNDPKKYQPQEQIQVWFSESARNSTMYSIADGKAAIISYTAANPDNTYTYTVAGGGNWSQSVDKGKSKMAKNGLSTSNLLHLYFTRNIIFKTTVGSAAAASLALNLQNYFTTEKNRYTNINVNITNNQCFVLTGVTTIDESSSFPLKSSSSSKLEANSLAISDDIESKINNVIAGIQDLPLYKYL